MSDGRIPVERIEITRAEGLVALCGKTETAASFEEANRILVRWSSTVYGRGTEGCDFRIVFADGKEYNGTYGLARNPEGPTDLGAHVRDMLGLVLSDDPERANFRKFIDKDGSKRAAALEFVKAYDVPSPIALPEIEAPSLRI